MFKLQRLEIKGFKSFADHTEINFGNGVTAIVGPNGCGKSNILEAICWVLGEQRLKTLRSSETKDLIFQGTSLRPASSMAEVVLHLVCDQDFNSAESKAEDEEEITRRKWKSHFQNFHFRKGETISITRRLFVSGESEYLLNGQTCRLRDIQDLLAGTGLSGTRYAIIEQGYIGQILSTKPTDRRMLIDEAAGISKFRTRQKVVEAHLESAKTNLTRINDIIQEVEKQVNSLHRQAQKTERYKKLRESIRQKLKKVYSAEGSRLMQLINQINEELEEAENSETDLSNSISEKTAQLERLQLEVAEAEAKTKDLERLQTESIIRKNQYESQIEYCKNQIQSLADRSNLIEKELEEAKQKINELEQEIKILKQKECSEREEKQKYQEILQESETVYRQENEKMKLLENEFRKKEDEKKQHQLALEHLNSLYRQAESRFERLIERLEGLTREGERADRNFHEYNQEAETLSKSLENLEQNLQMIQEEIDLLTNEESEKKSVLTSFKEQLAELKQKLLQNQHLLENFKELESKGKIYTPAVQRVLNEQEKIGIKLIGVLADKLNVSKELEKAVENIFGDYLQTLLVKSKEDVLKLLEYSNNHEMGRISVLIVPDEIFQKNNSKSSNRIGELLGAPHPLDLILKEVFSRETSARLVERIDLCSQNGQIIADQKGNLSMYGKFFVIGKQNKEESSSILFFKRRIKELEQETELLANKTKEKENLAAKVQRSLEELNSKIQQKKQEANLLEKQILSNSVRLDSLKQEIQRTKRHKNIVAEEIKQIREDLNATQTKLEEIKAKMKDARKTFEKSAEEASRLAKTLDNTRKYLEKISSDLNQKKTLTQIAEERQKATINSIRRMEIELAETQKRILQLNIESEENEKKHKKLNSEIAELNKNLTFEDKNLAEIKQELQQVKLNLENLKKEAETLNSSLNIQNANLLKIKEKRSKIEIRKTEAIVTLRNLDENCSRDLGKPLTELIEEKETVDDLTETYEEIEQIKQKLENLGPINMLATEELSQAEERLRFLNEQRDDVTKSIKDAQEALSEIKKRSREKFTQAFEAINRNFKRLFAELFGGGNGELRLIESEEILESGIEIIAQPPGKRLQNILLLSGGEKALTAIAFTLAIFEFCPSPFCILDEVDAPLDDANILKFTDKIRQMASKTQFLIITHNKKTMEAAENLYGVTMQEKGISKIVSVELKSYGN